MSTILLFMNVPINLNIIKITIQIFELAKKSIDKPHLDIYTSLIQELCKTKRR